MRTVCCPGRFLTSKSDFYECIDILMSANLLYFWVELRRAHILTYLNLEWPLNAYVTLCEIYSSLAGPTGMDLKIRSIVNYTSN